MPAGVPYSEHSSFAELREFVRHFRPTRIVPTVNVGSAKAREAMQAHFREWLMPAAGQEQQHRRRSS